MNEEEFDPKLAATRAYIKAKDYARTVHERQKVWSVERLRNLNRRTFILITVGFVFFTFTYVLVVRAPANFPLEQFVVVTSGQSLDQIAQELKAQGVVRSSLWLKTIIRIRGAQHKVHAGEYLFSHPRNVFSVARAVSTGAFGLDSARLTIPEGSTIAEMAVIFDKRLIGFDPEKFFLLALELEGYLFPDTYHFLPNTTEEEIIAVMRDNFEEQVGQFLPELSESEYSLHEVVTMASIIEKEARNERDRRLISGVLWNRIERGMLLQVDATFVYTHGKGTYGITVSELQDDSNPYNTYVYKGLPPGPIAAPSASSLRATLNPIDNDYLFYLANRQGETFYSETYEEHLVKKRKYVD